MADNPPFARRELLLKILPTWIVRLAILGVVLVAWMIPTTPITRATPPLPQAAELIPISVPAGYVPPTPDSSDQARIGNHQGQVSPAGVQMYTFLNSGEATAVSDMAITWARYSLAWRTLEPTQDTYNWAAYDSELQAAANSGLRLIVTIRDNPDWASNTLCGPIDRVPISVFASTVGRIVDRYSKPPFNIHYWELYNEPDNEDTIFRQGIGGCWGQDPAGYAQMLQAVAPKIRAADPQAKIVIGGLAMDWFTCTDATVTPTTDGSCDWITPDRPGFVRYNFLQRVIEAGGAPYFDIMNFHYYQTFRLRWEEHGTDVAGKTAVVRNLLQSYGFEKEIIVTEMGTWSNSQFGGSDKWMSDYPAQVMSRAFASDLGVATWFEIRDPRENTIGHGLLNPDGSYKDTTSAFKAFNQQVDGAFSVRRLAAASELGHPQTEGYEFRGMPSGNQTWVIWTAPPFTDQRPFKLDDPEFPLSISVPRPLRWLDKFGNDLPLPPGDPVALTITTAPTYLEYGDSNPPDTPTPTVTLTPTSSPTFTSTSTATPTATPPPISVVVEPAVETVPWLTPAPGRTPGAPGRLASNDFGSTLLLEWPAGGFDAGSTITYSHRNSYAPPGRRSLGRSFLLEASGPNGNPLVWPATPVTLTLSYEGVTLGVVNESTIELYRLDGSDWVTATISAMLDMTQDRLTGLIDRLGLFALFAEGWQLRLPVVSRSSNDGW